MPDNHRDHRAGAATETPARTPFAGPRLELPRFQFAPPSHQSPPPGRSHAPAAAHVPARPAPAATPRPSLFVNAPSMAPAPVAAPAARPSAPMPVYQATATAPAQPMQVAYAAPAPAPVHAQAPQQPQHSPAAQAMATASTTRPAATINWDALQAPAPEQRSLLQRITPVHIGVLMVTVMVMMVVTSGPAAMSVQPSRLPATPEISGGGIDGMNPRAGAAVVNAAADAGATPKAAKSAKARKTTKGSGAAPRVRAKTIRVGSATLKRSVRAGGIPSPAAGTNLAIAGGGRATDVTTGDVRLNGIPSAAAGEKLAPETLPYTPDDGVTMARDSGERDAHAMDSHYGADTLPMEEPALPAMTPGAAAQQAERMVIRNELTGGHASRPAVSTGAPVAY